MTDRDVGRVPDKHPIPDEALIRRILAGENDLYGELVRRHYRMAMAVCFGITGSREDSQDVVQEVFLRCYEGLARLKARTKFRHYLAAAARNHAINLVKQRNRERRRQQTMLERFRDDFRLYLRAPSQPEGRDLRDAVRRRLQALPPHSREVVSLYYFDHLRTPEIAELLGISEAAVRKRLQFGRDTLRTALEGEIAPAIQTEEEREYHIGVVLATFRLLPTPAAQKALSGPRPTIRRAWLAVLSGLALVLSAGILLHLEFSRSRSAVPAVTPPPFTPMPATQPPTTTGGEAPADRTLVQREARRRDEPPSRVPVNARTPTAIRIGPPPYSLLPQQLEPLQTLAGELASVHGAEIHVDITDSSKGEPVHRAAGPGNVVFLEDSPTDPNESLARYIAEGRLVPLTDRVASPEFDQDDVFSNLWRAVSRDGEIWAVPVLVRSWALGIHADQAPLDGAAVNSRRWSDVFHSLASGRSDRTGAGLAGTTLFTLPASRVWDCLLWEAGGGYDSGDAPQTAAWQTTRRRFASLCELVPDMFVLDDGAPGPTERRYVLIVTDGVGNPACLATRKQDDPAWVAVAPSGTGPVPPARFTVAAIRRSTPAEETLAWAYVRELVSPNRMAAFVDQHGLTPFRHSVANRVTDPDRRVFITQLRNMVFPAPNEVAAQNLQVRERELSELLDQYRQDGATEGGT